MEPGRQICLKLHSKEKINRPFEGRNLSHYNKTFSTSCFWLDLFLPTHVQICLKMSTMQIISLTQMHPHSHQTAPEVLYFNVKRRDDIMTSPPTTDLLVMRAGCCRTRSSSRPSLSSSRLRAMSAS